MIDKFIHAVWGKDPTKLFFISSSSISSKAFSIVKLLIHLAIFLDSTEKVGYVVFCPTLCLCHCVNCNVRVKYFSYIFIFNFRCFIFVKIRHLFYPLVYYFFSKGRVYAFEPIFMPNLARSLTSPPPVCTSCCQLYFLFILLGLSCVGVFASSNLTLFFLTLLFRGPIVLFLVTLMFPGKFFLLILSYFAMNDVPLGNVPCFEAARRLNTIFFVSSSSIILLVTPSLFVLFLFFFCIFLYPQYTKLLLLQIVFLSF